jgi:hypothetical protein
MIVLGVFMLTGHFHVDTHYDIAIGIHASALERLPSYYNSAIWTSAVIEVISLILLPLVLLGVRRHIGVLRGVSIMPWVIVDIGVLFAVFVWPRMLAQGSGDGLFDPSTTSLMPYLLQAQVPIMAGLVLGSGLLAFRWSRRQGV